ncbi:hypothetical protein NESM_000083400 [Novymonas esmeraldas]|uniref:BRCT domain-containing protein n=1 Tax=Novymonas esmeraldas TaxID=1808958 RepID=A0AAW0F2E0_9TRYP
MEVPATRPEVTTTGIYGEELNAVRQRLLRSDWCWCGDLTSRTQVLVVGAPPCTASRKLSVARLRGLPCVSPAWVTDGGCAMEAAERYDVGHDLAGKEVCTTSLNHVERARVQAACTARGAVYSGLLTRRCECLVASSATLAVASPSVSSPATSSDKVRFARKHGVPIIALEEFVLRYGAEQVVRQRPPAEERAAERATLDGLSLKGSSGLSTGSSSHHRHHQHAVDGASDQKPEAVSSVTSASAGSLGLRSAGEVLVCGSVRSSALLARSATPTLQPRDVACSRHGSGRLLSHHDGEEESWRGGDSVMPSAVQPSASSSQVVQPTPAASTIAGASPPALSWRPLADEFSDVVAYCSPPHRLSAQRYDLLTGMGVTVASQLTPFATHVLVLGEGVEECLFPRPGLQVVSWHWIAQCRLQQRRLSCTAFRVECDFRPVLTFTGLAPADRHALVSALRQSGLPGEMQDAFVLGGSSSSSNSGGRRRGDAPVAALPSPPSASNSCLPRSTTHLVVPRGALLSSQKVAVLAQHHHQHSTRLRSRSSSSSSPLPPPLPCRLVGVDWVHRSIQQGQWLDADLFALTVPAPEAFALAASTRTPLSSAAVLRGSRASQESLSRGQRVSPSSPASVTLATLSLRRPSPSLPGCLHSQDGTGRTAGGCVTMAGSAEAREPRGEVAVEEEEEEAASSQQQRQEQQAEACSGPSLTPPPRPSRRDDDDEEAGGESPLAAAAARLALLAIHSTPPQPPPPAAASQPTSAPTSSSPHGHGGNGPATANHAKEEVATALHHHHQDAVDPVASASHADLTTQYSPGLEHLLGELEAGPTAALLATMVAQRPGARQPPPRDAANASTHSALSGGTDGEQAQRTHSYASTPPSAGADICVEQRALLRRPSALPPHAWQRQQLLGRTASDESQVVFYQMGTADDAGVAASGSAAPGGGGGGGGGACSASEVRVALMAAEAAYVYRRSAGAAAVLLVTKDVLKSDFDWDEFARRFPQVHRTSKPEECTHFITAKPSKTEQFLCCLAAGRWILTPAYVAACAQAGHLVHEAAFEWSVELAASMGFRSSVASLVRGCRVQREAQLLPFASWRVRVCCTDAARTASFLRVLSNGGCTALEAATVAEVLTASSERRATSPGVTELVLADDAVFTEEELLSYTLRPDSVACPIMRLEYLVQFLCAPDTPRSEMDLLNCVHSRKRSRAEEVVVD